jgi:hypothetical protein
MTWKAPTICALLIAGGAGLAAAVELDEGAGGVDTTCTKGRQTVTMPQTSAQLLNSLGGASYYRAVWKSPELTVAYFELAHPGSATDPYSYIMSGTSNIDGIWCTAGPLNCAIPPGLDAWIDETLQAVGSASPGVIRAPPLDEPNANCLD